MDKKQKNAQSNKVKKQQAAMAALLLARTHGPLALADAVRRGNQYVRAVVSGLHLDGSIPIFPFTDEEWDTVQIVRKMAGAYGPDPVKLDMNELYLRIKLWVEFEKLVSSAKQSSFDRG